MKRNRGFIKLADKEEIGNFEIGMMIWAVNRKEGSFSLYRTQDPLFGVNDEDEADRIIDKTINDSLTLEFESSKCRACKGREEDKRPLAHEIYQKILRS